MTISSIVVMTILILLFIVGRIKGDKEKAKEAGRLFRLKSLRNWRKGASEKKLSNKKNV